MDEKLLVEILNNLTLNTLVEAVSKVEGLEVIDVLDYLYEIGE